MSEKCSICLRGKEACEYCADLSDPDHEAICDCGLHDFGAHIVTCDERFRFKYVIASGYESAMVPR